MALKTITFSIQVTTNSLFVTTNEIKQNIANALIQGGFFVDSVNILDSYSFDTRYALVTAQAENNLTDESLRGYAAQLLSNSGLFRGVNVQLVNQSSIPKTVNYDETGQGQGTVENALNQTIGKNLTDTLGLGLGLSTPVVIGIGLLLVWLYVKK